MAEMVPVLKCLTSVHAQILLMNISILYGFFVAADIVLCAGGV